MPAHPNRSRAGNPARNPKPVEIVLMREGAHLTQTEAAAMVHANLRSWQKWELGERQMHPAFWELFQIKVDESAERRERAALKARIDELARDKEMLGRRASK